MLCDVLLDRTEDADTKFAKAFKRVVDAKPVDPKTLNLTRSKVRKVTKIENPEDQYVYDISMRHPENHYFFANNMLVHNSTYFTAWPAFKEEVEAGRVNWDKETVIRLYDKLADDVSDTFPEFMKDMFNVPIESSSGVIVAGREIVAESGLFIKKKRYAALVYDNEGQRCDVDGKAGKVKAMGLDLRRSDTPKFVQEFLSDILLDTLTHKGEDHIVEKVRIFKEKFIAMKPWEKGSPKAVNNLTRYRESEQEAIQQRRMGKSVRFTMPGHVKASLNWNKLRDINGDMVTGKIVDAQKIIVCKLKETANNLMTSIAYPVDETNLPEWFTSLPFDEELMLETIVDKKVENLLWVLEWDFSKTDADAAHFGSLFD